MKDIKFRQYLKPEYHQSYGAAFHYWGYLEGDESFTSPVGKNMSLHRGDQYTGVKDSKGIDIYEGDIVEFERTKCYVEFNDNNTPEVLGWNLMKMHGGKAYDHYYGASPNDECEVIGNLYQNKEIK